MAEPPWPPPNPRRPFDWNEERAEWDDPSPAEDRLGCLMVALATAALAAGMALLYFGVLR